MAVTTTKTNKPLNPRGNDQSPKGYNRAELYTGKALDFDGVNDDITIPNSDSINITGDALTIAGYINTDGSTAWQGICYKDGGNNKGYQLFVDKTGDPNIAFGVHTGTFYRLFSNEVIENNKWYFVVATYDGVNQSIYINGAFDNSQAVTGNISNSSTENLYIGRNKAGSERFNGEISGFRIFNTALTAAQVADLYNNPEKIVPTGVADSALKLWLPMMEGAGTTAYDGSGNGNHGTISGATWTHGIGAPVAQTAVIDWNKGSNLVPDVNNFNSAYEVTTTTGLADDPAGRSNAVRFTKTTDTTPRYGFQTCGSATLLGNTDYVISLFYKYDGHAFTSSIQYNNSGHFDLSWACNLNIAASGVTIASASNCTGKVVEYSNDWYRVDVELTTGASPSGNPQYLVKMQGNTGTSLLVAYAQLEQASSVGPLVPTFGTAQTTPVLLPQGLTTGRDITGVNLFENVRKQGALNLDGNSWAEVHDNASLDITDAITLEAWVWYLEGDSDWAAISKYQNSSEAFMMFFYPARSVKFFANGGQKATTGNVLTNNAWNHVVITYDKTNVKIYIDGNEEASTAYTTALTTTSKVVEIGRYWGSNAYGTDGSKIAQPRIYNRALNASEIERNYNAGKNIYK